MSVCPWGGYGPASLHLHHYNHSSALLFPPTIIKLGFLPLNYSQQKSWSHLFKVLQVLLAFFHADSVTS